MKSWFFIFCLCCWSTQALTQPRIISGFVQDAETKQPIAHASISIPALKLTTQSDDRGFFSLRATSLSTYQLTGSHVNYHANSISISTSQVDSFQVVLLLTPLVQWENELVFSASRRKEKRTFAPAQTLVISQRDLQLHAGSNVQELFANLPGLEYTRTGVDGIQLNARGFNSAFNNKMLLLVDHRNAMGVGSGGLPMWNTSSANKEDMEKVEVVLGPHAALFGPNAHNGVVSILTKDPRVYTGTTVATSIGNQQQRSVRLRHAQKINKRWAYKITGEYATGKEFNMLDSVYAGGTFYGPAVVIPERKVDFRFKHLRGETHLYFSPAPKTTAVLSAGTAYHDYIQVTTTARNQMQGITHSFVQGRLTHGNLFVQVYHAWATLGDAYIIANYTRDYYNRTNSTITSGPLFPSFGKLSPEEAEKFAMRYGNKFHENNRRLNGEVQYNKQVEKTNTHLTLNAFYQLDQPNSHGITLVDSFQRIQTQQLGAAVQVDQPMPKGFRLVGALRFDHHNNFGGFWSPKLALLNHQPFGTFRFSWSRAYAMPSILHQYARIGNSLFGNGQGILFSPNLSVISDPTQRKTTSPLLPEKISTWEIGFLGALHPKWKLEWTAYLGNTAYFLSPAQSVGGRVWQVGDVPIIQNPATAGVVGRGDTLKGASFLSYFNYGKVNAYGTDIQLGYTPIQSLRMLLCYSWFGSNITQARPENDANKDGYVSEEETSRNAPRHRAAFILQWADPRTKKWSAQASLRWVESFDFYSGAQIGTEAGEGKRGIITRPGLPPLLKNFNRGALGGFKTIDVHASYQWNTKFSTNLSVTNLFNSLQREFVGSPSIGRLYSLQVRLHVDPRSKSETKGQP